MFYSQTFLARKGPLGTVWCAAHLQHRLKKSHYTSTDINSVVDRIMWPEVPIALRMSAHLLLGVSLIYSKKVDYLLHDCNVLMVGLKKALIATDIYLAENDRTVAFDSVTLPDTFNLDDVEIDYDDRSTDINLRSHEDITLPDQIPTGVEPFVAITFDDDLDDDDLPSGPANDLGTIPVTDDMEPPFTSADLDGNHETFVPSNQTEVLHTETETQLQDDTAGPSNQTETQRDDTESGPSNVTINLGSRGTDNDNNNNNDSSPDFGIMRDAVHDSGPVRLPLLSPIREMERDLLEKETTTSSPIPQGPPLFHSGEPSFQLRPHSGPPNSPPPEPSGGDPLFSDANSPPGDMTPGIRVASSPPVQEPQPDQPAQQPDQPPGDQLRPRRGRKRFFDEGTVLPNKRMKRQLENCTDLLRTRRKTPSSSLDIWRQNKKLKKDRVFHEPLLTGMSSELSSFFEEGHDFVNRHAILPEQDASEIQVERTSPVRDVDPEPANPSSPPAAVDTVVVEPTDGNPSSPPAAVVTVVVEPTDGNPSVLEDMDIDPAEQMRHVEIHHHDDLPEIPHSPPPRQDDLSTPSPKHFQPIEETLGSEIPQTADVATSIGTYMSEFMTPRTNDDDPFFNEDTQLSQILELRDSPEMEDHYTPEADNTPAGSLKKSGKGGTHQLSGRTRAVAQYLERQSPTTAAFQGQDPPKEISLNKILEGKPRKLCARMFYETLVLKSHGVVEVEREQPQERIRLKFDVQQDEPYGDILLKLGRLD